MIMGKWAKEQENIIYWAGTTIQGLGNYQVKGPKYERYRNYNDKTFKFMITHRQKVKSIAEMKTKEIHEIIYNKEIPKHSLGNIYKGRNTKLISLNYRIATNHLRTAVYQDNQLRACIFCQISPPIFCMHKA